MKRFLFITIASILFLSFVNLQTYAKTATDSGVPTASPVPSPTTALMNTIDQQINQLKDKIASRVAQLNLVEKKGVIGTVTDVTSTQISLTDIQGNQRFVDVDEFTKFTSESSKANFGISDITKGTTLSVLGLYNKESRRILARFVDVVALPQYFTGTIVDIDKKNFNFYIATKDKANQFIDVENLTKTSVYSADTGLQRAGFSKITIGGHVIVIGFPDKNDATHTIASRILLFPDFPANPEIKVTITPTANLSETPISPTK